MDSPASTPSRKSGIPRPSRLPTRLPKPSTSTTNITPQEPVRTSIGQSSNPERPPAQATLLDGPDRSDSRQRSVRDGPGTENHTPLVKPRKPRPSLSDRTVETLASIPPSPSPARRKSSFFTTQSPMPSPTRPPSAMQTKYSAFDRASIATRSTSHQTIQPGSPIRQPNRAPSPVKPLKTPTLSNVDRVKDAAVRRSSAAVQDRDTPSTRAGPKGRRAPSAQDRSNGVGRLSSRPNIQSLNTPQKAQIKKGINRQSDARTTDTISVTCDTVSPKSSAALRQTIARAKAAHRAVSGSLKPSHAPAPETFPVIELGGDSKSMSKRMATAREKGSLNISNMGLKKLPNQLLSLYDASGFDSMDGSWAESVDLLKINVADNEIEQLDEKFFPKDGDEEDEEGTLVLAPVETFDLHGNQLTDLPQGLSRLERLSNLNLSRNFLNGESLSIICRLTGLRELRLANNKFSSIGDDDLVDLASLEVLDLSENALSVVSNVISKMSKLHTLVLSGNRITSLPDNIFQELQLRELLVARNSLKGSLLPCLPAGLASLRTLDASYNALTDLTSDPEIVLPSLQTLSISQNRLKTLPNFAALHSLVTFQADGNQLTEMPPGLADLASLKTVDLSRNDIRFVEPYVGAMHGLTSLSIASNPIRERRLLTMNTEDLKRDMRARLVENGTSVGLDGESPSVEAGNEADTSEGILIHPGGVLDMSSSGKEDFNDSWFQEVSQTNSVKSLILSQCALKMIPAAIGCTGRTLTSLDLSRNKLTGTTYLSSTLSLPKLKILNLSANSIASLLPLLECLSAEALDEIDLSRNRLTSLPSLRSAFPRLSTIKAADNSISDLPFESVQGLQVLDVSANCIKTLEPKIGLLSQEGLRVFLVGANTFRVPRRDIVDKGTEAILTWLRGRISDD